MKQPNILFVFDDQHRYTAMGSSGNSVVKTPNFDCLAAEGMVFDQSFSNCPICGPYRGQLLSGMYSHKNGVLDNEYQLRRDIPTLPGMLGAAGYHTGYVGKLHLGHGPYTEARRLGFDYMAANNCAHHYYTQRYRENEGELESIEGWGPEKETNQAIRFMEEHVASHDSPFFLVLGWGPPHWPYDQYPEEFNCYDPENVDLPPNVPEQMQAFARKELADYYGNITALDAQMGRVLDALERMGLAEDTVVIFTSDHGDHLSSHGYGKPFDTWMHHSMRASKATAYDESCHVPFLVRYPRQIAAGARTSTMMGSVDLMPTMLGLAGANMPDGMQGMDLSPVMRGEPCETPDSVYLQILGPGWPNRTKFVGLWRGLRTDRWVYARWWQHEHGPWLFDREADPWEMNNLAGQGLPIEQELETRLKKWIADTDDPFDTGERHPETGMLQLGQQSLYEGY